MTSKAGTAHKAELRTNRQTKEPFLPAVFSAGSETLFCSCSPRFRFRSWLDLATGIQDLEQFQSARPRFYGASDQQRPRLYWNRDQNPDRKYAQPVRARNYPPHMHGHIRQQAKFVGGQLYRRPVNKGPRRTVINHQPANINCIGSVASGAAHKGTQTGQ